MKRITASLLLAAAFAVSACGDDEGAPGGDPEATGTVATVTDPLETSRPSRPPLTAGPVQATSESSNRSEPTVPQAVADAPAIRAAVADLAARLGIDPDAIEVLKVREVTWPDGSLGCPEPGVGYTQALVNGQLVVLGAGGGRYEYHSGPNRPLFYCANSTPPVADGGGGAGDI